MVHDEATVGGGKWSAKDWPLGDAADSLPFTLTSNLVLATPACATRLSQLADGSDANDFTASLPAGCSVIGAVNVQVTSR